MIAEFSAALSSAKAVADIIAAGKGVIDQAKLASAVMDLNSKLLDTQGAAMRIQNESATLQARVHELERAANERSAWTAEAAQYTQTQISSGLFAYVPNDAPAGSAYMGLPKYCCACFEAGGKALLQQEHVTEGRMLALVCPNKHPRLVFRYAVNRPRPVHRRW